MYLPQENATPRWVVPTALRGVMLMHADDEPCAGHRGVKATYETLFLIGQR